MTRNQLIQAGIDQMKREVSKMENLKAKLTTVGTRIQSDALSGRVIGFDKASGVVTLTTESGEEGPMNLMDLVDGITRGWLKFAD